MSQRIDERCDCGKLLFKKTTRGIEFKCTRCKRIHLIPSDWITSEYHSLCPIVDGNQNAPEARDRESNAHKKKGGMN